MERFLFPASALVLVLAACGAGHHASAPQVTPVSSQSTPSVKSVAAARERVAAREADRLLSRIRLPAGARPVHGVPSDLRTNNLGVSVITQFAYRHRVWKLRQPLAAVVRFVKRHALAGFENSTGGERPLWIGYDQPPSRGWPMQRMYGLSLVQHGGWTIVRIDAAAAWIYPRSPREAVPAGVHEIDIRGANVDRAVRSARDVARVVRWFGQLNVSPNVSVICGIDLSRPVHLTFRSASGAELARAVVPSEGADGCVPIQFTIGGKRQAALVDRRYGRYAFAERVQRLLGLCFRDARRACR